MEQQYRLFTSCIWQTTSAVVPAEDRLYLFDPAYFPHEVEAIASYVRQVRGDRKLVLVLTHGDWDHIAGFLSFPDATIIAQKEILAPGRLEQQIEKIREFDGKYYIPRPYELSAPVFGRIVDAVDEWHDELFLSVPGHTADQMAVLFRQKKLMVVGDMLSNLEFPFVNDSAAYLESLAKIEQLVLEGAVEEIIPGHGVPARGRQEILARVERDRRYLEEGRRLIRQGVAEGIEHDKLLVQFAEMSYDGRPIVKYLLSAHEANGKLLIYEAANGKG